MAGRFIETVEFQATAAGALLEAPTADASDAQPHRQYLVELTPDAGATDWRMYNAKGTVITAGTALATSKILPYTVERREFPLTIFSVGDSDGDVTFIHDTQ